MTGDIDNQPKPQPTIERLEDQILWYDSRSRASQRFFKRAKVVEIIAAAMIPFVSVLRAPYTPYITAGLGMLITVIEGLLHLGQYQQNWTAYRSTCEALKHEKYVYLASASPYAGVENAYALLTERVESLVSQEHAKWASTQQQEFKPKA
jgi:hypothetical protein